MPHCIDLYYRLATLLDSGIPIRQAFQIVGDSDSARVRQGLRQAMAVIDQGGDLQEALPAARLFSEVEIALMVAGDKGGRLPEILHRLAEQNEKQQQRLHTLLSRLAYPALLIHAAIFLPPLVILVQAGLPAYLGKVMPLLLMVYALVGLPLVIWKLSQAVPALAATLEHLVFAVPLLGTFILKYQLAQAITLFHGLYSSGLPFMAIFDQLIKASGLISLRTLFVRVRGRVGRGMSLQEATAGESLLPKPLRDLIATGEVAGKLDRTLLSARDLLDQDADLAMRMFISTSGTIIFLAVAAAIASQVITTYLGYFDQISKFTH